MTQRFGLHLCPIWSFPPTPTEKDKKLNPKAMITNKRPKTIGQIQTKYKHLALSKTTEFLKGESGSCGHCALCDCYGKHNKSMAPRASQIMRKTKTFPLDQNLTCADYGIYVVTYVLCHEFRKISVSNSVLRKYCFP